MLTRPRRAAICTLLPLILGASAALAQTSSLQPAPRLIGEVARFGTIEIEEIRAQGWADLIDSQRLKKQLAALDGSLTYREGALGFYRVSYEAVGDRNQGSVRVTITIVGQNGDRTILASSESVQSWRDGVFLYSPPPDSQNSAFGTEIPLPPNDVFGTRLTPQAPQGAQPTGEIRAYPSPFAALRLHSSSQPFCAPDPNPKREEKPKIEPRRAPDPAPEPRREEQPRPQRNTKIRERPRPAPNPQPEFDPQPQTNSRPQRAPDPNPPARDTRPSPRPQRGPDPNPPRQFNQPQRPTSRPQQGPDPNPSPSYGRFPNPAPPSSGIRPAPVREWRRPNYARPNYRPYRYDWDYRYDAYLGYPWGYRPNYYDYSVTNNDTITHNYYGAPYAQARDSFARSRSSGVAQAFEFALIQARARAEADFDRQLRGATALED